MTTGGIGLGDGSVVSKVGFSGRRVYNCVRCGTREGCVWLEEFEDGWRERENCLMKEGFGVSENESSVKMVMLVGRMWKGVVSGSKCVLLVCS